MLYSLIFLLYITKKEESSLFSIENFFCEQITCELEFKFLKIFNTISSSFRQEKINSSFSSK